MLSTGARRNPRGHHAGDRYWINSSAVSNSVSGNVSPSAFAVLRLIANSILVDVRPANRRASQNAADVYTCYAKCIRNNRPVAHKTASRDVLSGGWPALRVALQTL
jgi:hypothetical protein